MLIIKILLMYILSNYCNDIQTNLYQEVTFGKKKKWPYKTGDLLKEAQFI